MALRHIGAARLRRAASGRAGFVALACALYLAAGILATWPAVEHWRTAYLAGGAPGYGEASRRRLPADELALLARRAPARAPARPLARPVHVPPRVGRCRQPRRLAVRAALVAALRAVRPRRRLEPVRAPLLRRRRRPDLRVATRARARPRAGARRRARLRDRAVPDRAERRPPARPHLDAAPARAPRGREGRPPLGSRRRGRARLDPALGPGPPRARRDPVRGRLRVRARARADRPRRLRRGDRRADCSCSER